MYSLNSLVLIYLIYSGNFCGLVSSFLLWKNFIKYSWFSIFSMRMGLKDLPFHYPNMKSAMVLALSILSENLTNKVYCHPICVRSLELSILLPHVECLLCVRHCSMKYSAFKKKRMLQKCDNMNEPWGHYTNWNSQS